MAQGFPQSPVTPGHGSSEESPQARRTLLRWGAIGALGGFLFGYDTGVISGALLFIKDDFDLGSFEQGAVVSVLLLGAMLGAGLAAKPADRYGRRPTWRSSPWSTPWASSRLQWPRAWARCSRPAS